jgi:putative endonuclease
MEEYVVYILYSFGGRITYVGFSNCSIERFHWHNSKSKKGFTIRYRPWYMIHIEFYNSKKDALKRESFFKTGMGRSWIKENILRNLQ